MHISNNYSLTAVFDGFCEHDLRKSLSPLLIDGEQVLEAKRLLSRKLAPMESPQRLASLVIDGRRAGP